MYISSTVDPTQNAFFKGRQTLGLIFNWKQIKCTNGYSGTAEG